MPARCRSYDKQLPKTAEGSPSIINDSTTTRTMRTPPTISLMLPRNFHLTFDNTRLPLAVSCLAVIPNQEPNECH
jgi:hypothetical protein